MRNSGNVNNTVGSSRIGFIFSSYNGTKTCKAAGDIKAYSCEYGVVANPFTFSV